MSIKFENLDEILLSEIFDVRRGKRLTKEDRIKGQLPFVTAGENNNGIAEFVDNDLEIFENKLSIDMFGNCFYHSYRFGCDDNILVLFPKINFNENFLLFIATLINQDRFRYRFGRQYRQKDFKKQIIKLPFDSNGQIDIESIDKFMNEFKMRERESIYANNKISLNVISLDINSWQEFKMIEIFEDIIRGRRLKSEDREHNIDRGLTLYFSASELDNGLTDKISNPLFKQKEALIYTTFGDCFYVENEFTTSDEINIFKHSKMDKYSALFIATIINQNKYRYRFGRKAFFNKFENEIIKLPSKNGIPDWKFMSDYIISLSYSKYI